MEKGILETLWKVDMLNSKGLKEYILHLRNEIVDLQPRIKESLSKGEPKRQYKKDHMTLDDENELIARKSKNVKDAESNS